MSETLPRKDDDLSSFRLFQRLSAEERVLSAEQDVLWHRSLIRSMERLTHDMNSPLGVCLTLASHLKAMTVEDVPVGDRPALSEPLDLLISQLGELHQLIDGNAMLAACATPEPLESMDLLEAIERTVAMYLIDRRYGGPNLLVVMAGPRPWAGHRDHLERMLTAVFAHFRHGAPDSGGTGQVVVTVEQSELAGKPAWSIRFQEKRGNGHTGPGSGGTASPALNMIVHHTVTGPLRGQLTVRSDDNNCRTVVITVPQSL